MKRSFIHVKEAYYGESALGNPSGKGQIDQIDLMVEDKGESASLLLEWRFLYGSEKGCELRVFSDAFWALPRVPGLLQYLSEQGEDCTPGEVCEKLLGLGFADETPRENPYSWKASCPKSKREVAEALTLLEETAERPRGPEVRAAISHLRAFLSKGGGK